MRNMVLTILIIAVLTMPAYARGGGAAPPADFTPQPRLIAPTTEEIDLTGRGHLEFKWSPHEGSRGFRDYYDFRLYEGYEMVESSLVVKKRVDPYTYQININSDIFKDGQVYTWSLRQSFIEQRKSERSTASFKVIKK